MNAKLDYVRKFYKKKLDCGKCLLELTDYDNVTMWWTVDALFYWAINKAINDDTSSKLNRRKIFIIFYKTVGIYIEFLYGLSLKVLLRVMSRILRKQTQSGKKNKSKIILCASDRMWGFVTDYETNKLKKTDSFFDSIIKKLNTRYTLLGVYTIDFFPIRGVKTFMDKLRNWHISYEPLNLYWSLDVWRGERNAFKHFKKLWDYLINDKVFREMCIHNGKDLYNQIKDELELYFLFLFPLAVKYIEMGKLMIKAEKPDLILLQNEQGWRERHYLVIAPKLENVPTLAIQHGVIHSLHKGYRYAKDEVSPDGSVEAPYCPIPDKTAVYGPYHYELLTEISAYPENSVVVTGQPRYDFLCHADKIYTKDKFLKKYHVNPNHKIILWTTQCHGISDEENKKNFKAVFETMQNIENATLIIKQHPREGEIYTKMIKDCLTNYKIDAVITPKSSDTYEQLFACDLMITRHSTTAMEAVALNKPVIILNLSGEPDPVEYVKEGVALGVYKEDNLKTAIGRLLNDDSELAKNREKYIEKYLYKIDGKATERVVNVIEVMINEWRKKNEK